MALKNQKDFIKEIKEHLDQSIEDLDPKTLSKIRASRIKAMEHSRKSMASWILPAGSIAAAALVLFIAAGLFNGIENHKSQITDINTTVDNEFLEISPEELMLVEMLSDDQELDLFENLEFYTWFAEDENNAG